MTSASDMTGRSAVKATVMHGSTANDRISSFAVPPNDLSCILLQIDFKLIPMIKALLPLIRSKALRNLVVYISVEQIVKPSRKCLMTSHEAWSIPICIACSIWIMVSLEHSIRCVPLGIFQLSIQVSGVRKFTTSHGSPKTSAVKGPS